MSVDASILLNQVLNIALFVWSEDYWNGTLFEVFKDSGKRLPNQKGKVNFFFSEGHFIYFDELAEKYKYINII